ncbi:MAG: glycosyltransferase family 2 protein [Rhodobacteraceae bacterium]|nr:glycosyltransferase family 2 protein [Paracoccaceae bacterium]
MARTLILCPTFTHADTLYAALASVQVQSDHDWEMVVIGDGAPDRTREIVESFASWDARISFRPFEKGPGYGEFYRDRVIRETEAEFICHLGDDDVWSDTHLAAMVALLHRADWAMSGVLRLSRNNQCQWRFANQGVAALRAAAAANPVLLSLGGLNNVAMRRAAYLRLPEGWTPAAPGRASDHTMWSKMLGQPWLRVAASTRPTFVKLGAHGPRAQDAPSVRMAEAAPLLARINRAGWIDQLRRGASIAGSLPRALAVAGPRQATSPEAALEAVGLRVTDDEAAFECGFDGALASLPLTPQQSSQLALVWGLMQGAPGPADRTGQLARRHPRLLTATLRELLTVDEELGRAALARVRDGLGLVLPAARAEIEHFIRQGDWMRAEAACDALGPAQAEPWIATLRQKIVRNRPPSD